MEEALEPKSYHRRHDPLSIVPKFLSGRSMSVRCINKLIHFFGNVRGCYLIASVCLCCFI